MWLHQPSLHRVDVPDDVPAIPADRCCNCGSTDDVVLEKVTLRRTIYVLVGGVETRVPLELPGCPRCKWTLYRAAPGSVARASYALLWSMLMLIGPALLLVMAGFKPPGGIGGLYAACLMVSLALTSWWYATRRPRGAQTSYYQPVRLLGRAARDGQRFSLLLFSNREIAEQVAANIRGSVSNRVAIPVARIVRG